MRICLYVLFYALCNFAIAMQPVAAEDESNFEYSIRDSNVKRSDIRIGVSDAEQNKGMAAMICMYYSSMYEKECTYFVYQDDESMLKGLKTGKSNFIITNGASSISNNLDIQKEYDLQSVAILRNDHFAIISRVDSKIKVIDDLAGRSVGISVGWGEKLFESLLSAKNIGISNNIRKDDFVIKHYVEIDDAMVKLCNKKLDAVVLYGHGYNKNMENVAKACEVSVLNFSNNDIKDFVTKNPWYIGMKIPAGKYYGMPFLVETFGTRIVLLTTSSTENELVHGIIKSTIKKFANISSISNMFVGMSMKDILAPINDIPQHSAVLGTMPKKKK